MSIITPVNIFNRLVLTDEEQRLIDIVIKRRGIKWVEKQFNNQHININNVIKNIKLLPSNVSYNKTKLIKLVYKTFGLYLANLIFKGDKVVIYDQLRINNVINNLIYEYNNVSYITTNNDKNFRKIWKKQYL